MLAWSACGGASGPEDVASGIAAVSAERCASAVVQVATGSDHTCARRTDGTLWCWGENEFGQLGDGTTTSNAVPQQVRALGDTVADVAAGGFTTCASKTDGTLWCWGANGLGELGDGTRTDSPVPKQVRALGDTIAEVTVGTGHVCARKTDGTLWCWGNNRRGQAGERRFGDVLVPQQISGLGTSVAEVAAGGSHTCARKTDGTLWCWGDDKYGQIDGETPGDSEVPVEVGALGDTVAEVAAGLFHTCARKTDGTLWCWGDNRDGQLGDGTTTKSHVPRQVTSLGTSVAKVAVGRLHTCARRTDGTLWCWGRDEYGQLGDEMATSSPVPVPVRALGDTVVAAAAGGDHTCARKTDGTLWCWGSNERGQLGDGTTTFSLVPRRMRSLEATFTEIATGLSHACARKTDGTLWCWGENRYGQLGDGTTTDSPVPVPVRALGDTVAAFIVGGSHTCARKTDGTVWCWGENQFGQLGNGTKTNSPVPVQVRVLGDAVAELKAKWVYTCARKTDGTVWCWGATVDAEIDGPAAGVLVPQQVSGLGTSAVEITAGGVHTCARKADGTLWCWGRNGLGELGDGTRTHSAVPVQVGALGDTVAEAKAGWQYACARKTDGTLWCWGDNLHGQLGDGTTTDRAVPVQVRALGDTVAEVAVSQSHTCARKTDGTLWCWGDNRYGQLGDGTMASSLVPQQVRALGASVAEITMNGSCARKTDGSLWCWGKNRLLDEVTPHDRAPRQALIGRCGPTE